MKYCSLLIALLTGCARLPYPHQLGLIAPPFPDLAVVTGDLVAGSSGLYRTKDASGAAYASVLCYAPPEFDVLQGPSGSFVWRRASRGEAEVEFVLRPAVTDEQLKALRGSVPVSVSPPVLLLPCGIEANTVSPVPQLPVGTEVSFANGKAQDNTDLVLVRIRARRSDEPSLLQMIQSATGILLKITYRVSGTNDVNHATGYLRSGT